MKINFLLIALLAGSSVPLLGMTLTKHTMPTEQTLRDRLIAHRFFVEKTGIIARVADKELNTLQVISIVKNSINDFAKKYPASSDEKEFFTQEDVEHLRAITLLEGQKATITEKLLQDFPREEKGKLRKMLRAKL